jgi:murein L,D-transpeptidase YafK
MKKLILYLLISCSFVFMTDSFKSQQQKFFRVKTAYHEKQTAIKDLFSLKGIDINSASIFIRVFKKEAQLEIWAKTPNHKSFLLVKTYEICTSSGVVGPKRKQGDGQVPEGFYEIGRFNPLSNFYLSLGVSYPNASDRILGDKENLGGDIFIHGNCVTIGCIPLTDDKIKEVYLMAVEAKSNGQQKIQVHVFPCRMNDWEMKNLETQYSTNPKMISFWKNIQIGYTFFEEKHILPSVSVLPSGLYFIK